MKIQKQLVFRTKEVSKLPKEFVKTINLECLAGGFYMIHLHNTITKHAHSYDKKYIAQVGHITLYIGDNRPSSSEPLMKVEHKFENQESAIIYAQYIMNREQE